MNIPKVTPPFSKADKQAIKDYSKWALSSGHFDPEDDISKLNHNDALAILLPSFNFDVGMAEFSLSMSNGKLPKNRTDDNGNTIEIVY